MLALREDGGEPRIGRRVPRVREVEALGRVAEKERAGQAQDGGLCHEIVGPRVRERADQRSTCAGERRGGGSRRQE